MFEWVRVKLRSPWPWVLGALVALGMALVAWTRAKPGVAPSVALQAALTARPSPRCELDKEPQELVERYVELVLATPEQMAAADPFQMSLARAEAERLEQVPRGSGPDPAAVSRGERAWAELSKLICSRVTTDELEGLGDALRLQPVPVPPAEADRRVRDLRRLKEVFSKLNGDTVNESAFQALRSEIARGEHLQHLTTNNDCIDVFEMPLALADELLRVSTDEVGSAWHDANLRKASSPPLSSRDSSPPLPPGDAASWSVVVSQLQAFLRRPRAGHRLYARVHSEC
jgi:hypothetical protein